MPCRKRYFYLVILTFAALATLGFGRYKKRYLSAPEQAAAAPQLLANVADPKPNEACFSPDEACGAKLIRFVQGARKSLDVAVYDINIDQLVRHLALQSRQIKVRVIVDQRQSQGDHSLVQLLVAAGVQTRYGRQRGIMHNKFIIRDGTMMETGSFNFTNHATLANSENQLYLDQPQILARFKMRFDRIWLEAQPIGAQGAVSIHAGSSSYYLNNHRKGMTQP